MRRDDRGDALCHRVRKWPVAALSRRRRAAMNVRFWNHPMGGVAAEVGRRLPLAIPLNELLLVAVARSRAAVPVSASSCPTAVLTRWGSPWPGIRVTQFGTSCGSQWAQAAELPDMKYRRDAGLAREIEVALPAELPSGAATDLAGGFADAIFVQSGMVVDLNVWTDRRADGAPAAWASLLLTTRVVEGGRFGRKVRAWNDRATLMAWREQWAAIANSALAAHGFAVTLDHRSNAARGIALEPQNKIGAASLRRARAGEVMELELQ
jgi:MobA/MobL family